MKKNAIALLLSIALAAGSIGTAPVLAAETTSEEASAVEEEDGLEEEVPEAIEGADTEGADTGLISDDVSEEEADQAGEEEPVEEEQEAEESAEERDESADIVVPEENADDEEVEDYADEGEPSAEVTENEEPAVIEEKIESSEENEAVQAGDVVDSGTCGDNATWTLTGEEDNLTLMISGEGTLSGNGIGQPWASYIDRITSLYIAEGITSIGFSAFYNHTSVTNVYIPEGMISIGSNAFSNCDKLTSLHIPKSVEFIGECAFSYYNGFSVYYDGNVEDWLGVEIENNTIGDLYFDGKAVKDIIVPNGVTKIRKHAFSWCTSLESVQLPESITSIEEEAFFECKNLKSINIPQSVQYIGAGVFMGCESLEQDIVIPEGVENIEGATFYHSGITAVTIPGSVNAIKERAFGYCENLKKLEMGEGVTRIEKDAFPFCQALRYVKVPSTINYIEKDAFDNMYVPYQGNCKIDISDLDAWLRIEYGGEYSVSGYCMGGDLYLNGKPLTDVVVPDGITEINQGPLTHMKNIKSITIPDSVKTLGTFAIWGCESLENVTVPKSVTRIAQNGIHNRWVHVRFRGTEAQWRKAVRSSSLLYRSIIFNCFSVSADFKLSGTTFIGTGKEIKPAVTVTYRGKKLTEGVDYKLAYMNNINAGYATVNINGIRNYSGTERLEFKILPGATSKVTCTNVASGIRVSWEKVGGATSYYVYRDNAYLFKTSALEVTDKEVKSNAGNKYVYKIIATKKGIGDSPKFRTATMYRLIPVGIKSLTNNEVGKMTVTYDKSSGSSGYVVRYGLKSDMSDARVVTVKGQNTLSRTFGGMKKGKTYYVQVRTYKIENGVRYYSGYCTTKTITIKK